MNFLYGILSSILGIVKGWFDKQNYEAKLENTVDMQERKKSQEFVTQRDIDEQTIKKIENGTEEERDAAMEEVRKSVSS